ncbi:MAG: hypothetical protein IJJ65_08450 [Butyrivibrio sp.]|nr:hypothetical protein [Butyrivibrio sp.]
MAKKFLSSFLQTLFGAVIALGVFSFTGFPVNAQGVGAVSIGSATINGGNVNISVSASDLPDSDDGKFYLFSEKPYQATVAGAPIASAAMGGSVSFQVPLNNKTADCRLYDKFQVAVLQGGQYVAVAGAKYITNPEALASASPARKNNGKKGLILDGAKIGNGNTENSQLGVQQAAYNINLEDVIGGNGQVVYEYNGKTYNFDSAYLSQYDHCVRTCTQQGMGVTIVLLNPRAAGEEFMISPSSRGGKALYYMMNTSEDKGLEYLEAVVSYLAYRYNGQNGFGQVDNWVIGNEVNAKNVWNYSSVNDLMSYAQLYADELRVCYNAIKSRNANAYVCISLDQNWTQIHNTGSYYSARATLEAINACITAQGNIDWGLAEHPYNYPMTWTTFWSPKNETAQAMIRHDINTPYLSMENIEQLTDYMCQPAMRNTKGAVRPILLTEVGYSSTQGEEAQAAAIVYAYQRVATNQYIKLIAFNRQTDYPLEVSQGLSVGLSKQDGTRKLAFEFYQQMNGPNAGTYIQRAAQIMGIADWNAAMNAR